nr:hypothetical protein [Tanacetum cinerariifolium]
MNPWGGSAAGYGGAQNKVENVNLIQARPGQARLDLALNVDNVFQDDNYNAFDSDVDEAPTAQTMFMANQSSADPDTLEIAEITRKKINDKMNEPKCVTRKVKIAPYDYSKENFLATFTTQKQLTPEQIFWSNDLMKLKSKALKEQTKGIQKALTKEINEMKDVFEELEAEVTQYAVDRKHDEIERKNLLIANDNLIAECLSQEVFYMVTNFELNVARFTEMHVSNTSVEARCPSLEAELANLREKSHHENQEELINHFSKLE